MTLSTLIRFTPRPAAAAQRSLMVEFRAQDERAWKAIGGGDTVADAIDFARDSCRAEATWKPVSWNDLYGD